MSYSCDVLREHKIAGNVSGIRWGSAEDAGDIIGYDKAIIDVCLKECPYKECKAKERDDRKEKRR